MLRPDAQITQCRSKDADALCEEVMQAAREQAYEDIQVHKDQVTLWETTSCHSCTLSSLAASTLI